MLPCLSRTSRFPKHLSPKTSRRPRTVSSPKGNQRRKRACQDMDKRLCRKARLLRCVSDHQSPMWRWCSGKPLKLDEAHGKNADTAVLRATQEGSGLLQEALRDHPGATRLPSSSTQAHCAALPLTLPALGQARSHQEEGSAAPWPTARVHSPCGNTHMRNTDACPLSVSSFCDCGRRGAS